MLAVSLRARGPYSLDASARGDLDVSRSYRGGWLELVLLGAGAPARARVRQRGDGAIEAFVQPLGEAPIEPEALVAELRFALALDDDHRPFLALARRDPLLADVVGRRAGRRPLRVGSVAHALLRAVCGQLIQAREARRLERAILCRVLPFGVPLRSPSTAELARLAPAQVAATGLAERRATALIRVLRSLDVERLRAVSPDAAVARLLREPGLGPWSAGVVATYGLGSYAHGLVGDLGLVRLLRALRGGGFADAAETAALLEPYGEWAGLASVHLLGHPLARTGPPAGVERAFGAPLRAGSRHAGVRAALYR
jgi:3-methyladenine DNA glycosylase/8-oxoguanine DNA glycosylase